ncbi:MAG TPA: alpha-amylase [Leptospiraceae bacterium]|jgi:alpha-amylase|nr:alpha-amylase [Leptospirales bacterium]HMU82776.1 alpha-amylase [Leptospiraceae bacterium]HMX56979.1 alpha-amylase [Leptospiraceae bacterium]HMZ36460.1 alpha-amylase [Leptospiraceae bacterium]HNE23224.1 alpha-amylase [Leptospiraceae bacterium]
MSDLNGVMMQYFQWYSPADGSYWKQTAANARELAAAGITALWLPPAYKGIGGGADVGYGVYDMYDLGEFNQKGSVRTKYGTKEEYLSCIQTLQQSGIQVYADTVLNHRMGGDNPETPVATPFWQDNRMYAKGEPRKIQAYTHFQFPGRAKKYSDFEWHWNHFDAVDYDGFNPNDHSTVYLLEGKQFDDRVAMEKGNFAYLMGCDLDCQSADVRAELIRWGKWYLDTTKVDGFRLDAIKHIAAWFFPEWLDTLEKYVNKDLFVVGEYWVPDVEALHNYLNLVGERMTVFDVPLHFNFHAASKSGGNFDMRRLFSGTLMEQRPRMAVTFVDNHDSQPLQALESCIEPWFKPLAYAAILLRREGYPCIFHPDYYGADYEDRGKDGNTYRIVMPSHRFLIDKFLYARRNFAYGPQYDYFDHYNSIGWTRLGDLSHPKSMAVLMSDGPAGHKWMETGKRGAQFRDITGHVSHIVTTNGDGWGEFHCNGGSVSVWVEE